MKRLEPKEKWKHRPSVSFQIGGSGRVNIILHEEVMDYCGFKVGDTVDVRVGKNGQGKQRLAITSGTDYTIKRTNYKASNHGKIVVSLEKLPKKSFNLFLRKKYVSLPLTYR